MAASVRSARIADKPPVFIEGLNGENEARAFNLDIPNGDVPEPAAWALMILGFGGVGMAMRERRPARAPRKAEAQARASRRRRRTAPTPPKPMIIIQAAVRNRVGRGESAFARGDLEGVEGGVAPWNYEYQVR